MTSSSLATRVTTTARSHARAVGRSEALRHERDGAIRAAHAGGLGIREIARLAKADPTHISRIVKR